MHSPDESFVPVTLPSYSQVWMLRPPTALFTTVTWSLNSGSNWRPQPTGQVDEPFAIVESPASQILGPAATAFTVGFTAQSVEAAWSAAAAWSVAARVLPA